MTTVESLLTRAVAEGATVPVYFEPRLIQVELAGDITEDQLDLAADEVTAGLDDAERTRIEQSVAVVNAVYGAPGTREICANLYSAIIALRPAWHSPDLDKGRIKVVYSGTPSDVPPVSDHVRRDSANATIKARLKDVDDELEIVIVKDMMLTG